MAISGDDRYAPPAGESGSGKLWNLCRMPFRQAAGAPAPASSSSSSGIHHSAGRYGHEAPAAGDGGAPGAPAGISTVAKALLPARRRLRLDPSNKLYFPFARSPSSYSGNRLVVEEVPIDLADGFLCTTHGRRFFVDKREKLLSEILDLVAGDKIWSI